MTKGFKKKLRSISIGLASLLIVVYLIAQFWVSYRLNPLLGRLIKNGVINSSDSIYSIRYQELAFNIATSTLVLKDVDLKADTGLFAKRKANADYVPSGLVNIHLNELKITGIEFIEAWINNNLEATKIIIENPTITFTLYDTLARRDTIIKQPVNFNLYKLFSEQFHSLTVQNIVVKNAVFKLFENSTDTTAKVSSNGIQIEVSNLKIDSAYSASRYEIDLAGKIRIRIAETYWILPDSIYRVQFSNIVLDATKQLLNFENIKVVPLVSKYKISKIEGYETDLIQMNIDSLALQKLDMNLLLYNHSISCRHVQVQNFNIKSFRFKGARQKPGYRTLPVEQLRNAPLMIRIDSVRLKNGRIEYAEQIPDNSFPGTIFFDDITGSILNISNNRTSLRSYPNCIITADGMVMGKGKMNIKVAFNQTSTVDSFTFEGNLGKMELSLFNPMILQSANVKLKEGTLDALAFIIEATNHRASGRMTMQYHDLTVEMPQYEEAKHGQAPQEGKKNIESILVNTFAIVSENPKDSITRHVTLYQERNTEKYIFYYLWKTILSGVKETILTSNMKRSIENKKK